MRVKFEGGTKDVQLTEVTKENYIVPKGEEGIYHVIQEVKEFDRKTGKRLSKPVLQKYDAKVWNQQRKALLSWGYDLIIVHDPTEYNARKTAEREQLAAEKRKAAMEAEQQRKAEERAALKAELMAELRAEMDAEQPAEKETTAKAKAKKSNK